MFFFFNFALSHRIEQGLIARYAYRETGGEIPHVNQVPERCWFYSSFFFLLLLPFVRDDEQLAISTKRLLLLVA